MGGVGFALAYFVVPEPPAARRRRPGRGGAATATNAAAPAAPDGRCATDGSPRGRENQAQRLPKSRPTAARP